MRRLVAACLAAVLLAGCSAVAAPDPDVLVTGDPGSRPTLTYVTPLAVSKAVHKVVWQGTSDQLVDGEPVLVDFWLEDASDAAVVKESYSSSPTARPLTVEDLG
ncbi:MAG TPA: FKBP-type peptidyl-prolyl cis-trans isomerase, partial [Cellulomonas sp.]